VPVGVDHAGHNDAAGRVDLGRALGNLQAVADGSDALAGDQDVGALQDAMGVVHGQHRGVSEHQGPARGQLSGGGGFGGHREPPWAGRRDEAGAADEAGTAG
jgi:hypothetical protein